MKKTTAFIYWVPDYIVFSKCSTINNNLKLRLSHVQVDLKVCVINNKKYIYPSISLNLSIYLIITQH